jgi:hypothetical protein
MCAASARAEAEERHEAEKAEGHDAFYAELWERRKALPRDFSYVTRVGYDHDGRAVTASGDRA